MILQGFSVSEKNEEQGEPCHKNLEIDPEIRTAKRLGKKRCMLKLYSRKDKVTIIINKWELKCVRSLRVSVRKHTKIMKRRKDSKCALEKMGGPRRVKTFL